MATHPASQLHRDTCPGLELHKQVRELVHCMLSEATEWYEGMAVHTVEVPT
jgi:hypothetical protein